ncbi:hypothetical protein Aduo_012834 [Ancylostoma duodenale]
MLETDVKRFWSSTSNNDCPTLLIEMLFHMLADVRDEESGPVEEFSKAFTAFAGVENKDWPTCCFTPAVSCTSRRLSAEIMVQTATFFTSGAST